jgi:toxin CptA
MAVLALYLAAGLALWITALPIAVRLSGLAALSLGIALAWRRRPLVRLRGKADGTLELLRGDTWRTIQVSMGSVALPGLIVLRWREGRRGQALALPGDALAPDAHRRLRIWLRWRARPGVTPVQ